MRNMELKRAHDRARLKRKRSTLKAQMLDAKGVYACIDCGYSKCQQALEFDHLRDKTFMLSGWYGRNHTWEAVLEEIKKCEVVCANCHRERTMARRAYKGESPSPSLL